MLFTEKNANNLQNDVKRRQNIDKKYCDKKKRYGTKRLLAEFPNKRWPLKRLQRKIDNTGSGRKRKVIIEQKCTIISVKFC